MKAGNRRILLGLLLLFSNPIVSQEIKYYKQNEYSIAEDLSVVLEDYFYHDPDKHKILLIDFKKMNDTVNAFRLLCSSHLFELLFKEPDCYFTYKEHIIYLYTPSYAEKKDSIWLQQILDETAQLLAYPWFTRVFMDGRKEEEKEKYQKFLNRVKVVWATDSVIYPVNPYMTIEMHYDPATSEYWVCKGKIIRCNPYIKDNEMFYPNTGKPKGLFDFENYYKEEKK